MKISTWPTAQTARVTWRMRDFSHGLDLSAAQGLLPDGAATAMDHCAIDGRTLRNAGGINPLHDQPLPAGARSIMAYHNGEDTLLLAALANGQIWQISQGKTSLFYQGYTPEPTAWVSYQNNGQDVLIFGNQTAGMLEYNGQTVRAYQKCPNPRALTLHKERLWMLPADDPMAVQCSDDMYPEDWSQTLSTGALIRILTWDGSRCTGLQTVFEDLLVAKEHSIWRIWGSDPTNYQLSPVYSGKGAVANRSLAVGERGMAFMAHEGIFLYDGVRCSPIQSQRIRPLFEQVNPQYAQRAAGVYHNNRYYLALPLGQATCNNAVLCYDFTLQAFTLRYGVAVNDWLVLDGKLYCATEDGYVAEYDSGTMLLGKSYSTYWMGATRGMDTHPGTKALQQLTATVRGSGTLQLIWQADGGRQHRLGIPLQPGWRTVTLPLEGRGKLFNFGFCTTPNTQFEIADAAVTAVVVN